MTFSDSNTSSSFRWPKSFFHDLANACVRYANKWLHLCPFVCLYTLFILSYCRVALERMSPFLLLKSNVFPDYKIIFSQTLNKNIVLFHLENAEFCILIQAWTIFVFCFHNIMKRSGQEKIQSYEENVYLIIEWLFNLAIDLAKLFNVALQHIY